MSRVVRSLNRLGIERLRGYLAQLRSGAPRAPPTELLEDSALSNELPVEIEMDERRFAGRFQVGQFLNELLSPLGVDVTDRDVGLWAWLALALFDQVCPVDEEGKRHPGRDYRHIPEFGYRGRYRHLLFGPYQVYRRHGVHSILLLSGSVDSESGLYHEITSRQDLIANKGVIDAALMLYFDPKSRRPKAGAQGSLHQPGTVRRFVRVLQQLDVTYDIYGLSGRQILELLPEEFDGFQPRRLVALDAQELARLAAARDEHPPIR
jgi:hypothetical protein